MSLNSNQWMIIIFGTIFFICLTMLVYLGGTRNYNNLAIEVLIILGIFLFFRINKLIADNIK